MTTDKQTDYFKSYSNVEVINGNGTLGFFRAVGQLKNGKWALWESSSLWGGNTTRPRRLRDLSGYLVSFATKAEAVDFSNKQR